MDKGLQAFQSADKRETQCDRNSNPVSVPCFQAAIANIEISDSEQVFANTPKPEALFTLSKPQVPVFAKPKGQPISTFEITGPKTKPDVY